MQNLIREIVDPRKVDHQTLDEIRPFSEHDLEVGYGILAWERPKVLSRILEAVGLSMTTEWYTREMDVWHVRTDGGSLIFSGTLHETVTYAKGYVLAWLDVTQRARRVLKHIGSLVDEASQDVDMPLGPEGHR